MSKRILIPENLKASLDFTKDIQEIAQPFFKNTRINYFNYVRKYSDGSNIALSTHQDWSRRFYQDCFYDPVDNNRNLETLKKREEEAGFRRFFRFEFNDCPAGKTARDIYNVDVSLSMFMVNENYYDCYFFGSEVNKFRDELTLLYHEHKEIITRFIFYFHEKAQQIINKVDKFENRILIPSNEVHNGSLFNQDNIKENYDNIDALHGELKLNRFRLIIGNNEYFLSLRETQCLALWVKGNTLKKIGNEIGISSRTVETNLNRVKEKLNCYTKTEILKLIYGKKIGSSNTKKINSNISIIESILWNNAT